MELQAGSVQLGHSPYKMVLVLLCMIVDGEMSEWRRAIIQYNSRLLEISKWDVMAPWLSQLLSTRGSWV